MMRVYSDFDGTIAVHDIGNKLFRKYAGAKALEIVQYFLDGTMTARECLTQECAAVPGVTPGELEEFVHQFSLDPSFGAFVEFCRHRDIPLVVLSDGLDFYVEHLQEGPGTGFTLLDASRGGRGDPADDATCLSVNYVFFALERPGAWARGLGPLWRRFWQVYLQESGDRELLEVAAPWLAWRALVFASPRFYPDLPAAAREALLGLAERALGAPRFDPGAAEELFR